MAREPQDIIKHQLGSLIMEVAILTSENEKLKEELKTYVREPDNKTNPKPPLINKE